MGEWTIRAAVPGDWPSIWPFWHDIVAEGASYTRDPDTDEATARRLWMLPAPARVFVAVDRADQVVLGTAVLKPNQPGLGDHVANASFMVAPAAAGRGVGRRLAGHVLAEAGTAGYQAMQFNAVVETNTAAVALWRSLGFEVLATVPGAFRHRTLGQVGLHVMYRGL